VYGQNIAYLRNRKGLTQKALAAELNISGGALGMYEVEKREPDIAVMQKIAEYFGVDIGFIITGRLSGTSDPLFERICRLSPESRADIEKYTELLELKEKHGK
jgi:transcriptional regulator with XRE-family HTH domain